MRRFALPAALLLLGACITVAEQETKTLGARRPAQERWERLFRSQEIGALQVRSLVYKPAALPLSDFLKKLARGDYKTALQSLHLRYSPSNVDDEGMKLLLREGLTPVLVDVANAGLEPVDLRRLRLTLKDPSRSLTPLPNDNLPRIFQGFNPKAAAANVYNTGAVVVGSIAVVVTFVGSLVAPAMNAGPAGPSGPPEFPYLLGDMLEKFDGDVYNAVRKTTYLDYGDLLWSAPTLAPGARARGLLFFKAEESDRAALRLEAELADRT